MRDQNPGPEDRPADETISADTRSDRERGQRDYGGLQLDDAATEQAGDVGADPPGGLGLDIGGGTTGIAGDDEQNSAP